MCVFRSESVVDRSMSSKHALAMSLMSRYVAGLSMYYLHLGSSDITVPVDYIDNIRDFVQRETRRRRRLTTWTVLEFSSPTHTSDSSSATSNEDFVGYFLHSADLVRFATFFLTFDVRGRDGDNHTATLQRIFLDIVTQRVSLCRRPVLFRLRGGVGAESDDEDVKKPWPSADDPAATVLSSMRSVGSHTVDLVYASGGGYFHSSSVAAGDWIAVIFETDVIIDHILVQTGLPDGSFILRSGFIELSPRLLKLDTSVPSVVCADFVRVGEIAGKSTELNNVAQSVWGRATRCLRLIVGELGDNAAGDVVFHQIAVFT